MGGTETGYKNLTGETRHVYVIMLFWWKNHYASDHLRGWGGQYDVNYKNRLWRKWMDKNDSGSCPMTSFYTKSAESLGSVARSLINFIREVWQR